jgi:predicted transcriptional regulator
MQEIKRTDKQLFICPFCSQTFRALARHTNQIHGITGRELRKRFGLKQSYQLITLDLRKEHQKLAYKHNMHERLIKLGRKTRYKEGHSGHLKNDWSEQALIELSERTKQMMRLKRNK